MLDWLKRDWRKKWKEVIFGKPPRSREPLKKVLLGAIPLLAIASLITQLTEAAGRFGGKENNVLDNALHIKPLNFDDKTPFIVNIDDEDYKVLFDERSPLDVLQIARLIDYIARGEPSVIALDISTAHQSFDRLNIKKDDDGRVQKISVVGEDQKTEIFQSEFTKPVRIVWAASAKLAPSEEKEDSEKDDVEPLRVSIKLLIDRIAEHVSKFVDSGGEKQVALVRAEVPLFGKAGDFDRGVAYMPLDSDGIMRRYARYVKDERTKEIVPTLVWSTVLASRNVLGYSRKELEPSILLVTQSKHFNSFKAGFFFDKKDRTKPSAIVSGANKSWSENLLKGRVVFVGGSYDVVHDQYATPIGIRPGVELAAAAVETELKECASQEVNPYVMLFAELTVGVLLVITNWRYPNGVIANFSLFLPICAPAISAILFRTTSLWVSFVPILFAVHYHQDEESKRERKRLELECEQMEGAGAHQS